MIPIAVVPDGRRSAAADRQSEDSRVKTICIVVSSVATVKAFLTHHIEALSRNYQVCLILNLEKGDSLPDFDAAVEVVAAPVVRDISLGRDLRALLFLVALFRRRRFHAVHSITPKAGILASLAAAIARIPVRIHTFTGQVWVTQHGLARQILKTIDKGVARMATHTLVDGPSQRDFLVREKVLFENKSRVLANGSIRGVDLALFRPDSGVRDGVRRREGIPENAVLFLYVGRFKVDKGVLDLAQAFSRVGRDRAQTWLLLVGTDEEGLLPRIASVCSVVGGRLRFVGHTDSPQEYMAAADVLCLPSYREGFSNVVIEAASAGVPVVASRIYGITDAIEPGATAFLHAPGDISGLESRMKQLADDPHLRGELGRSARSRVQRLFAADLVTSALVDFYESAIG